MSAEDFALAKAKETGQPYELVSARTESSDTWATPAGKWTVKRYGTPVRVLRGGAWVATDPTLVFGSDGKVVSKAATVSVSFSGGGTGPLLTGVKDGRTLSLTWPKALPKPTLAENVATYANVLPDVDLQVKAEVEGFSQLLVVKTASAAQNPELAALRFKLDTVGLNVATNAATGSITAVDPAGQTVFTSPSPSMWDSTTATSATPSLLKAAAASSFAEAVLGEGETPVPSDAFNQPAGAQEAQMPTTVANGTLEIKPDQALLTGAQTKYPVFIDPSWAWGERQNWTRVYAKYKNNSYWNSKDDVRVGYEDETNGLSRSFFQIDTSNIKGAQVNRSTLRIRNTWSWSCQARPVELWTLNGGISSATTWNNQPGKGTKLATVNESKGWSSGCAAGNLEFDATPLARQSAAGSWSSVTVGLYAGNESDTFGWKRFDPKTLTLETEYNNPPRTPSGLGTNPATSCTDGGTIGNTRVSLYGTIDDPDGGNLTAEFQVFKEGQSDPAVTQSIPANRGQVATWAVPDANLPNGAYTWKVRAKDQDGASSGWSTTCKFSIDRDRPTTPPMVSSIQFPDGKHGWPESTGKARTPGTFTFSANGVTDAKEILYYTDSEPGARAVAPGATVTIAPPGSGPHFVYATTVDKAGNRSDTTTYLYYANRSEERDGPGDLNGDGNRDIWTVDNQGALLTYAGQGNGKFSAATNGGRSFQGAQIQPSGDWGEDGYNDLITIQYDEGDKRKKLAVHPNDGQGAIIGDPVRLTVACPDKDIDAGCDYGDGWNGDDHWKNAEQIVSPGDINGDGNPDLLVKQGKQLWAYYGNRAQMSLDATNDGHPVLVGNGDWDKFTVVAPGDLNGDSLADLWLREDATGDVFRSYGNKDVNGVLDPTTWGNAAGRVKIASGLGQTTYPTIGSVGDVTGDTLPDLWVSNTNRQLAILSGTGTASPLNVAGISQSPAFFGNLNAPTAQWKLTGQNGNTTPSAVGNYPATTAGITWPTDTIGGRSTPYANFTTAQSAITTAGPVIDTRKSFTISTWAKPGTDPTTIIASQNLTRTSSFRLYADKATSKWYFALAYADLDGWPFTATTSTNDAAFFTSGAWSHLTAVYNADSGLMSLYVNGVLAGSNTHKASASPPPSGPLVLGHYQANGAPVDNLKGGGVSNFAVYPYAADLTTPGATGPISLTAAQAHCIDNAFGSTNDGSKITIYGCHAGDNQKFEIKGDGTIRIQGKCLDAYNNGTTNGTQIFLWTCWGGANQQFLPLANGWIYNPVSGRCLDLDHANTTPGVQLQLWECNTSNAQRWTIPALTTAPLPVPLW
ncbi:ricin-type beta-trefoil lectin domain protein [Streptomyces sp. ZAF1911]|uniref:ricin-type beta-trefoil lectin domain protein n=1 Tax=Streptomyces sp. ZAF1911 TaxID=2944129 RepID=UPI00237BDF65|nr:ricin-type beta-trefoil lectin domain protein [Streptomyces sp. ZAF1911]MDD9375114.1 ricin-type beta-trefoil lectin domain protein [Streptomyces sp. ZAF1911]